MTHKDSFLGSLLGLPVECLIVVNTNTKQQANLPKERLKDIQTGCLGDSAWGTVPNTAQQVWYVGIQ